MVINIQSTWPWGFFMVGNGQIAHFDYIVYDEE